MNRIYREKIRERERARLTAREKALSSEVEALKKVVRNPSTPLKDLQDARARLLDVISRRDAIHNRITSISREVS